MRYESIAAVDAIPAPHKAELINPKAIQSPVFVMGCERSGTSLLSGILDSHPSIAMYFESYYYSIFGPELRFYGDLRRTANLDFFLADVLSAVKMQTGQAPTLDEVKRVLVEPTFEGVLTTLLQLYANSQGKVRGGDKTPSHFYFLERILAGFPTSPVIFIIRDPRDTSLSIHKAFNTTLSGAAQQWNDAFNAYNRFKDRVHLVRYEDLVQNPIPTLRAICEFVREPFDEQMFQYSERVPERLRHRPLHKNLYREIDTSSISTFREMQPEQVELIESSCREGMEALGYEFVTAAMSPHPVPNASLSIPSRQTAKLPSQLIFLIDKLRYYRLDARRWRTGSFRWCLSLKVRLRYLLWQPK